MAGAAAVVSCGVFGPVDGASGEPCVMDNDECSAGLVCIQGICTGRAGLGEACDQNEFWYCSGFEAFPGEDCEEGLWCVEDVCVEAGGEDQPCRIDEQKSLCDPVADTTSPAPCEEGLACFIDRFSQSVANYTCRRPDEITEIGDWCICEAISSQGTPLCYQQCLFHDFESGLCSDGQTCNTSDGHCE
jgi:hypothetical protein